MARRTRHLKPSTDQSIGWLNHVNASDVDNLSLPRRRRTAHETSVYDLPVSPERPQRTPRSEPKNTGRNLRSRQKPINAQPESSPSPSIDEENREPSEAESQPEKSGSESNDSESAPIEERHDNNGELGQADNRDNPGNEDEVDPFPQQIDLFPAEDEDGNEDGDNASYEPEDSSSDEPSTEDQTKSTPLRVTHNAVEVQIPSSPARDRRTRSHPTDTPTKDLRPPKIVSSQPQEIPETPETQQSPPNQIPASTPHGIFTWLVETIKDSDFEQTWEDIRNTRKAIKREAEPYMKERFIHIRNMVYRLRGLYKTMSETAASDLSTRKDWRIQCSLIANNAFKEVQWILFDEAQNDEEAGATLANQLEAHIVPLLIDLVFFGFKMYKVQGDWATGHFCVSLDLLWGCSYKICSFAEVTYPIGMNVFASSRHLMIPVKNIKDALNNGRLNETAHGQFRRQTYKHVDISQLDSHISCGPWTRKEKDALRRAYETALKDELNGMFLLYFFGLSDNNR